MASVVGLMTLIDRIKRIVIASPDRQGRIARCTAVRQFREEHMLLINIKIGRRCGCCGKIEDLAMTWLCCKYSDQACLCLLDSYFSRKRGSRCWTKPWISSGGCCGWVDSKIDKLVEKLGRSAVASFKFFIAKFARQFQRPIQFADNNRRHFYTIEPVLFNKRVASRIGN